MDNSLFFSPHPNYPLSQSDYIANSPIESKFGPLCSCLKEHAVRTKIESAQTKKMLDCEDPQHPKDEKLLEEGQI